VEEALTAAILRGESRLDIEAVVAETKEARSRVNRALYHDLHRHRYRPDLAAAILERVPADLEARTARVVGEACRQFGFDTVAKPGENVWYFEFGSEATVEHVPGVPEGSRFLGTFNREEAVQRETLDFFAAGHPLVEGVLLELEDGHRGEVAMFEVRGTKWEGEGLAAVVREGASYRTVAVDFRGNPRPEWASLVGGENTVRHRMRPGDWNLGGDPELLEVWASRVRELLYPLQEEGSLAAVAAFRLRP
jgi:ATP-dependent helicase HepA